MRALSFTLFFLFAALDAKSSTVDLHVHLFMKEGIGPLFKGDFFGELKASSWEDRFSQQANAESLDHSGNSIVVAALYAHPLFNLSLKESVRRQIAQAHEFVQKYPNWVLAKNPKVARDALLQNKKVLILSLEGASGILETEEDLKEFIDGGGIRIVTLLHFSDDEFGGPAFLKGWAAFASPLSLLRHFIKYSFGHTEHWDGEVRLNDHGLTPQGQALARSLIKRKVWLDLTHASDQAQRELIVLIKQASHPLLYTHASLREFHRAERGTPPWQIEELKKTGGILGLMPSSWMLGGGLEAFADQYKKISLALGNPSNIMMASDFNGAIPHLPPTQHTETSLDQRGFWNIGQTAELWSALKIPQNRLDQMSETFLEVWEQVK